MYIIVEGLTPVFSYLGCSISPLRHALDSSFGYYAVRGRHSFHDGETRVAALAASIRRVRYGPCWSEEFGWRVVESCFIFKTCWEAELGIDV